MASNQIFIVSLLTALFSFVATSDPVNSRLWDIKPLLLLLLITFLLLLGPQEKKALQYLRCLPLSRTVRTAATIHQNEDRWV